MMKRMIVALAMLSTAFVAVPASAQYQQQYRPQYHDGGRVEVRLERLADRIERGRERGTLSGREATRLRWELTQIQRLEQRYGYDGLSRWERQDLDRRIFGLQTRLRNERQDGNDRRYGQGDGGWDNDDDRRWDRDDN